MTLSNICIAMPHLSTTYVPHPNFSLLKLECRDWLKGRHCHLLNAKKHSTGLYWQTLICSRKSFLKKKKKIYLPPSMQLGSETSRNGFISPKWLNNLKSNFT